MSNKKTILVLPGTLWQVPLVQKIKSMGHRVLIVNPSLNSPCFNYADGHLQSDIFDKTAVLNYGKDNKVDAVMSDECDIAMNLVAELGKAFNVETIDEETAALFTNKYLMREFCKKNGLPYPEYRICKNKEDAITLLLKLKKPIVIKPLDSNASHGVFRCDTVDDIVEHFAESMSFSRIEKSVLAERYIQGTEFTIDGVKTPTAHYTMAISEKKHFSHNKNIANELLFSHSNPDFDYDKLRDCNDAFVMKSNLKFGFTHAEYKCENGEFFLVETAARGGGNMISSCITQWMSGYDTYEYLIDCAIGNVHDESFVLRDEYKNRVAVLKFFSTPGSGGVVKEIHGSDYLEQEADIKFFRFNFNVGDKIQNAKNDSARIGFYIACSVSMEKLKQVIKKVDKNVIIELEK